MASKTINEKLKKIVDELEQSVLENEKESFIYQSLDEALPYPAMLINRDRTIIFANKAARKIGAVAGGICWRDFGNCDYISNQDKAYIKQNNLTKTIHCAFCLADTALNESKSIIATEINAFGKFWEFHWVPVTEDLFLHSAFDITERKQAMEVFKKSKGKLASELQTHEKKEKKRTGQLSDMKSTLEVLLKKREEDKRNIEEQVFSNYRQLILPIIDNLRKSRSGKTQQDLIDVLESEIKTIISPFSKKLSDPLVNLTPKEIEVAGLINFGKTNKEISEILNISMHTISRHREHIRKKLGLKNRKINLRSFLLTLN